MSEILTEAQLRAAIIEAVNDGDRYDALHYARRWRQLLPADHDHARRDGQSANDGFGVVKTDPKTKHDPEQDQERGKENTGNAHG